MYDCNITAQELADFHADMAEMAALVELPTEEDIEEMARWFWGD